MFDAYYTLRLFSFSFVYTRLHTPFRSVTGGLPDPSPLAFAVGHAAAFAMDAALVGCESMAAPRV